MSRKPTGNDPETKPKYPFGDALRLHLDRGTRPDGEYRRWKIAPEFAAAMGADPRTVSNWLSGKTPPPSLDRLKAVLFGDNPAANSGWAEFRDVYLSATGHRATRPTSAPTAAGPPPALDLPCPEFIGREADVAKIRDALLGNGPVVVQGPPGIGKSEITKKVAHDGAIVARFGAARYFIKLETASDAALLQHAIAQAIRPEPGFTYAHALAALKSEPALLVLDNLETPWSPTDCRAATEATLGELAGVPGLGLLASFRGRSRVGGAKWALAPVVDRLPEPLDRELFLSLAGEALADDAHLPDFLTALDGLPLALDLVARRAFGRASLDDLWKQWRAIGVRLAEHPDYDPARTTSLYASLELSLASERMKGSADRLFRLLGASPAGIAHEDRDHWLGEEGFRAEEVLLALGLAHEREGRLDLLAPIREYARRERPPSPEDAEAWRKRYLALAREIGEVLTTKAGFGGMARLGPEFANISAAIDACLPDRRDEALAAVPGFGRFAYLGGRPAPILTDLAAACERAGDVLGEARCIEKLGDIALARSNHEEARAAYQKAIPLFQNVGDVLGEANCIQRLGEIALRRSDHEEARAAFEKAIPLHHNVGDVLGEANCIQRLGEIALARSNHEEARAAYQKAIPLYQNVGDVLGEANCIQSLGDIALERSNHEEARAAYQKAILLYQNVGDVLGEANCIQSLGDIALRRSKHEEARAAHQKAIPLFQNVGSVLGEANCITRLGDIALARSNPEEARAAYQQALPMYAHVGHLFGEGVCLVGLGDVARAQGDKAAARGFYEQALPLFERFGDPVSLEICQQRLAALDEGDAPE